MVGDVGYILGRGGNILDGGVWRGVYFRWWWVEVCLLCVVAGGGKFILGGGGWWGGAGNFRVW